MRKLSAANKLAQGIRNTKLNLLHRCAPTYQISQANVPVAFILTAGKQLIVRKLPRHATYFVDKHLGVFHLQPAHAFFLKKTAVYFFDSRAGNPLDPGLMQELYDWANHQGIYHIRRVDIRHAAELQARGLIDLTTEQERKRQGTRSFIASVLEEIENKNKAIKQQQQAEGGQASIDEYRPINEEQGSYIITEHLYSQGYIDHNQREKLNTKLRQKEIIKLDQLLEALVTLGDPRKSLFKK